MKRALALLLAVAACSAGDASPSYLSAEAPFGFSWQGSARQGRLFDTEHRRGCREYWWEEDFREKLRSALMRDCLAENYAYVFLRAKHVPEPIRDGSVSVIRTEDGHPAAFNYSYLHRSLTGGTPITEGSDARLARARVLREQLTGAYGPPNASGYFNQRGAVGFIPDNESDECEVWIEGDIAVMLCSEWVIMIDGIEMSLTYLHLDRIPVPAVAAAWHELGREGAP